LVRLEDFIPEYDSGRVDYTYVTLENLYEIYLNCNLTISDLRAHRFGHENGSNHEAPLELVFNVASDVMWKPKWIPETDPETTM
jgi:hypothetical protein